MVVSVVVMVCVVVARVVVGRSLVWIFRSGERSHPSTMHPLHPPPSPPPNLTFRKCPTPSVRCSRNQTRNLPSHQGNFPHPHPRPHYSPDLPNPISTCLVSASSRRGRKETQGERKRETERIVERTKQERWRGKRVVMWVKLIDMHQHQEGRSLCGEVCGRSL